MELPVLYKLYYRETQKDLVLLSNMDRYEQRRKIGHGSFGDVYLVIQRRTQKCFAMKEINMCRLNKKELIDVTREVEILSKLAHQNIVQYVESFGNYSTG